MSDCPRATSERQSEVKDNEEERKVAPPVTAHSRTLEKELEEVRAAIDENWDEMEESLRYLADR